MFVVIKDALINTDRLDSFEKDEMEVDGSMKYVIRLDWSHDSAGRFGWDTEEERDRVWDYIVFRLEGNICKMQEKYEQLGAKKCGGCQNGR